jgi:hypothetical protein
MAHFTSIAPHHTMAEFKATPNKELRRGAKDPSAYDHVRTSRQCTERYRASLIRIRP